MTQPVAFTRAYGATVYTDESTSTPTVPHTGTKMDGEFNNVKTTTDQIRTNLALIQRDDGQLANASVGTDQLASSVYIGVGTPAAWVTAHAYVVGNSVINGTGWYRCAIAHTSGTFATDLAAVDWVLIYDFAATLSALLLTSSAPAALANAAVVGVSTQAARADHVHAGLSNATPTALGGAATAGASAIASRDDHVHAVPASTAFGLLLGAAQTTNFAAVVNTQYVLTKSAAVTVTMPAAAAAGDTIAIDIGGTTGLVTFALNGLKYYGTTTNPVTSIEGTQVFRYHSAARGWIDL